jgi:hypothetical protein
MLLIATLFFLPRGIVPELADRWAARRRPGPVAP